MTRAILVNFHLYTPFGKEFYEPILDFFLRNMKKYSEEYDHLYLLDSNWEIEPQKIKGMKVSIIRTNLSMRYYDCFKAVLPQVKEDLVLFMDNDMVVYRRDEINTTFNLLNTFDVVSIYDTIGTMKVDLPNGKNKFCPYWFATRKELLMKYLNVDWSPDAMPYTETFGLLTEAMLKDDVNNIEWQEDKTGIYIDGTQDGEKGKDLGYYHIRAGSTPAYLLATKKYGNIDTYNDYLKNQPKNEYLRQVAWYWHMINIAYDNDKAKIFGELWEIIEDAGVPIVDWGNYMNKFFLYHGLIK